MGRPPLNADGSERKYKGRKYKPKYQKKKTYEEGRLSAFKEMRDWAKK